MNDTQNQNLEKIIKLQLLFGELYDENFKTKNKEVYNAKIKDFNEELKSIGVDPNLSPKEIELKLQQIYEALEKEPLTKTTLNKDESEQLIKDSEKREADISKIKEGQEKAVEDFIKRNREKITKTQSVQEDIKDKKVYLKVEETEKTEFSVEEKKVFEQYKKEAVENPEEASIKMAREIHTRVDGVLKEQGLPQEEIENIVNKTAEKIVENIAVFDTPNYVPATMHIAINNAVFEKIPTTISKEAQEVIKSSIATNSVYRFQPDLFLKDVTKTAFGDKFAKIIFGADPNSYKISVSEIPTQQYSYTYSFSTINESSVQILNEQNQTVEILKGFGKDEARNYLINQSSAYFSKTAIGQKILSNSKTEIAFYSVFKSAGKTVTWTGGNFVGNAILKFAPEYAPVVNLLTGTKFVTPVVTQTATKIAGQAVGKAAGQVATEAVVGTAAKTGIAASMSATFAALGSWAPIVGNAIGAVVGYLFGKVLEKINWPKIKKWFSENGPVLAGVAGLGALALGGPAVGGIVLLGGLAVTGTLGAFAAGAFSVLGFIGRSVGIAIATPVIVTLLVLPPLVAFIMLVINNSAYVVPPAPVGSSPIHIPPGGNLTKCDPVKTGADITDQLASSIQSGSVYFLPNSAPSRKEGLCMIPTMIILHTSGGYDNEDGNNRTYETLVQRNVSCQMATDTDDTILMLSFFEKQVENAWCADNLNAGGVSIEMAGECQGSGCAQISKCSPNTNLTYTPNGPHPCEPLEDLSFDAICKVMQKYKIPWTQVFQHEASNGTHTDPIGDAWVDKFILRLKNNCQI